jgi:hypothetical protein
MEIQSFAIANDFIQNLNTLPIIFRKVSPNTTTPQRTSTRGLGIHGALQSNP